MSIKNNLLSVTNLSASLVLLASTYARAANFSIGSGITETSQQILASGETGIIASGGVLTVTGDHAVLLDGAVSGASLINYGTIATIGNGSRGVFDNGYNSSDNIIINNGIIETNGIGSSGISSYGEGAAITNSGTIATDEVFSFGIISTGASTTINNSGTIATQGDESTGIYSFVGIGVTISNSGTINTEGDGAFGILSSGAEAAISNSGSIVTRGDNSSGIRSNGTKTSISNGGAIITQGNNSSGILSANSEAVITNSGTLTINGGGSAGIVSTGTSANITNGGTINTGGDSSFGILSAQTNVNITNSGTINTEGEVSVGILSVGASSNITNGGVITINGSGSSGILVSGENANITNSGTILVSGDSISGISLDISGSQNSTLNNSGKIFATGDAIVGGVGIQSVTLAKGSQIIGNVDLGGGTEDSITIAGNGISSRVVTNNVETLTISNGVAGAISGKIIYTVDPTGSAMLTTSVNNLSLNIHKIANSRTSFANSSFAANKAKSAWMQVFGSSFNRGEDEGNLEYKSNQRGIIGGYDLDSNSESSSVNGIMFGLSSGDAKTTSESFNVDSTSVFIGAYKNFNLSRATILSATILGGYEQYETKRKLVDNLNGFQTAKSDFNNIFFSPSLALEHKIKLNNTVDIAPEARVVYTSSFFGNQKETGSTANLNTKSRNAQILNSRAGVKAVMNLDDYKIELGAGLDNRLIKEGDVRSSVDGASLKYNTNNDKNVTGRYFKFSVRSGELKGVSLLASFEKRYASGNEDETFGQFSASYRF